MVFPFETDSRGSSSTLTDYHTEDLTPYLRPDKSGNILILTVLPIKRLIDSQDSFVH